MERDSPWMKFIEKVLQISYYFFLFVDLFVNIFAYIVICCLFTLILLRFLAIYVLIQLIETCVIDFAHCVCWQKYCIWFQTLIFNDHSKISSVSIHVFYAKSSTTECWTKPYSFFFSGIFDANYTSRHAFKSSSPLGPLKLGTCILTFEPDSRLHEVTF